MVVRFIDLAGPFLRETCLDIDQQEKLFKFLFFYVQLSNVFFQVKQTPDLFHVTQIQLRRPRTSY